MKSSKSGDEEIDDDKLLKTTTKSQFQDLCRQLNLSVDGTKEEMLSRLRRYAEEQAEADKERRRRQVEKIAIGVDDSQPSGKAKYKITATDPIEEEDDDDELEGVFYYSLPGQVPANQTKSLAKVTTTTINPQNSERGAITAPPPPPGVEPNENGERVVTIYSSTDQNDLTGIAAQASRDDVAMAGGYSRSDANRANSDNPENTLAGGPFGDQSGSQRKKAGIREMESAVEVITELVQSLLAMTGAPGFQEQFSEGISPFMTDEEKEQFKSSAKSPAFDQVEFTGFDPSRVPTQLVTQASKALRVGNGEALRKVLDDFEMQAIGFDGINGDDKKKGGGHYLEVQKVGTFLDGFRKAEVRKNARETASMLLDTLVTDGVKGLDQRLMIMTKGSDDSSDSGELNDALVKYLENAVRDQEQKIEQMYGSQSVAVNNHQNNHDSNMGDSISELWSVTRDKDGKILETLDPNDPKVQDALQEELRRGSSKVNASIPLDPARQLLMLLTLLRERVKAEAVFSNDEKGRNLRILAYCIHAKNEKEREKIIVDNLGNSLEKLDSFSELLQSSIDYAESTSYQLQPSKSAPLDPLLLKSIKSSVNDIKERQAWKASGIASSEQYRDLSK
jgi:hypothetical protein